MNEIIVPEIIKPPSIKLLPIITEFNNYTYFLAHGGRSGGKSWFIARLCLYLGETKNLRICVARETMTSLSESVKILFTNIINEFSLSYRWYKDTLVNKKTGSTIFFAGLRECFSENNKGLEDVDLLWIEEAQKITQRTLDVIIPTIRKNKARVIFTMNRLKRNDPVYKDFSKRADCLTIKTNYVDNIYCPEKTKQDAEQMKAEDINKFNHVYMGEPEDISDLMLFRPTKLDLIKKLHFSRSNYPHIKGMGLDLAGSGGDSVVANLIETVGYNKFRQTKVESWACADTDYTTGKALSLFAQWKPDILTVDADGLGYPIYVTLSKTIKNIFAFHGGGVSNQENCLNARADGYFLLQNLVNSQSIEISHEDVLRQLEYIEKDYSSRNFKLIIKDKKTIRKNYGESPDFADSTMMNIFGLTYELQNFSDDDENYDSVVEFSDYDPFE